MQQMELLHDPEYADLPLETRFIPVGSRSEALKVVVDEAGRGKY